MTKSLFAAEREFEKLRMGRTEADGAQMWTVEQRIAQLAPNTLAGAAIKLRRLGDPDIGIEAGATTEDPGSVRQVLELVERLLGKTDGAMFRAAEREIVEADRLAQAAATDAELQPVYQRHEAACDFIELAEPQSLAGSR